MPSAIDINSVTYLKENLYLLDDLVHSDPEIIDFLANYSPEIPRPSDSNYPDINKNGIWFKYDSLLTKLYHKEVFKNYMIEYDFKRLLWGLDFFYGDFRVTGGTGGGVEIIHEIDTIEIHKLSSFNQDNYSLLLNTTVPFVLSTIFMHDTELSNMTSPFVLNYNNVYDYILTMEGLIPTEQYYNDNSFLSESKADMQYVFDYLEELGYALENVSMFDLRGSSRDLVSLQT